MKIAVLLGGTSAERDVSLVTGLAIAKALVENGHDVTAIDCAFGVKIIDDLNQDPATLIHHQPSEIEKQRKELDRNLFQTIDYLIQESFDLVFNGLHGGYGENGELQAILDVAQIPYTGSGPLASALGMNKHLSKILYRSAGIPTAEWVYLPSSKYKNRKREQIEQLGYPVVVKPNEQGSSVGLTIVHHPRELDDALARAFDHSPSVIAEKFVPGRELTVGILGDTALPVIEIRPRGGIYDYEAKYQAGLTQYDVPADIPAPIAESLKTAALKAFRVMGCQDYARIDFRLQEDGQFFCLEVNTLPGMTPTSLVPKAAAAIGISFNELVEKIVRLALERTQPRE